MRKLSDRSDRGANLVEFAILAPLLIMLVFGIVDFAWILSKHQDVRHGAREAARLAAVNTDDVAAMIPLVCSAMSLSSGTTVSFTDGGREVGDTGTVTVTSPVSSLTGFSSLPFVGALYPTSFTETITFRLERDATTWSTGTGPACP
jgi:Flp pilus assembly protein TadG